MHPDPIFRVTLKPEAVQRLGKSTNQFDQEAGGCDDLLMLLAEQDIQHGDILLIDPVTTDGGVLFDENEKKVADAVRVIADTTDAVLGLGALDVFLAVDPRVKAYLIASVMNGKLVEYQVCDGPPGERGTSFDCYTFAEAKRIFDEVVAKGWKKAFKYNPLTIDQMVTACSNAFNERVQNMSVDHTEITVELDGGMDYTVSVEPFDNDDDEDDQSGTGSCLENYDFPSQLTDHTEVLDVCLAAIDRIENRPPILDLTTDGDGSDCEAIFFCNGDYYIVKVR